MSSGRTYSGARNRRVDGRYGDGSMGWSPRRRARGSPEGSPNLAPRHRGEVAEVREVADAPRPARAHRVELRHQPPRPTAPAWRGSAADPGGAGSPPACIQRCGSRRPIRGDAAVAWTVCHPQRKVGRHRHAQPPYRCAVDRPRVRVLLRNRAARATKHPRAETASETSCPSATWTRSSPPPSVTTSDGGRSSVHGRSSTAASASATSASVVASIAHRAQHGAQGRRGHLDSLPEERPVLGRDSPRRGERRQRGVGRTSDAAESVAMDSPRRGSSCQRGVRVDRPRRRGSA